MNIQMYVYISKKTNWKTMKYLLNIYYRTLSYRFFMNSLLLLACLENLSYCPRSLSL